MKTKIIGLICLFCLVSSVVYAQQPAGIGDWVQKGKVGFDVRAYGAKGNGTTNDRTAIYNANAAAVAAGGYLIFPRGTYKISSAVTIASPSQFFKGAVLSPDGGITATVTGEISAGQFQIITGSGTVAFGSGTASRVLPHWFGVKGDGATNDSTALGKALTAIKTNGGILFFPIGNYIINDTITIASMTGVTMAGVAGKSVITTTDTVMDGTRTAYFSFTSAVNCVIENLVFNDSPIVDTPSGAGWLADLEIETPIDLTIRNCHFIETVSCGMDIVGGTRVLVDGVTADGVRGYGNSGSDAWGLDGNFINMRGRSVGAVGGLGGNTVTNCRLDGYSALTSYHWDDGESSTNGIWHDNNCALLAEPGGTTYADAPDIIITDNYITKFLAGAYTEGSSSTNNGRLIFANNYVQSCYKGFCVNSSIAGIDLNIHGNTFHTMGDIPIYLLPAKVVNITGNNFYDWGTLTTGDELCQAVIFIGTVNASDINISNNIGVVENRALSGGSPINRIQAIKVAISTTKTLTNLTINGNHFSLAGRSDDSATYYGAIEIEGSAKYLTITGNSISHFCGHAIGIAKIGGGTADEIASHAVISGNLFNHNNDGASASNTVIYIGGNATDVAITGNVVRPSANTGNFITTADAADQVHAYNNILDSTAEIADWSSTGTDFGYDGVFPKLASKTMTGNETFVPEVNNLFLRDAGGVNRTFNPSGYFIAGYPICLVNTGSANTLTFDSSGIAVVVDVGEMGIFHYNGSAWVNSLLTQRDLSKGGTPTFADLTIIDGNQGASKVWTSDANGNGSWQTPTGGATGNMVVTTSDATGGNQTVNLVTAVGIADTTYTIIKTDATANVVTVDPNGAQTIDSASTYRLTKQWESLTIVSDGTNWVTAALNNVIINVKLFGATGDGSTNDTTAIQAAIAACPAGGVLYFPASSSYYKLTGALDISKVMIIVGDGKGSVIWQTADEHLFNINSATSAAFQFGSVRNLRLVSSATTAGKACIKINEADNWTFDNIIVYGGYYGIYNHGGLGHTFIHIEGDCTSDYVGSSGEYVVYMDVGSVHGKKPNATHVISSALSGSAGHYKRGFGYYGGGEGDFALIGVVFEGLTTNGAVITSTGQGSSIINCHFESGESKLDLTSVTGMTIQNCYLSDVEIDDSDNVTIDGCYMGGVVNPIMDIDSSNRNIRVTNFAYATGSVLANDSLGGVFTNRLNPAGKWADTPGETNDWQQNLVDGDMEVFQTNGLAMGFGWYEYGTSTFARETSIKKFGLSSQKVTCTNAGRDGFTYTLPSYCVGKIITVTAWVYMPTTAGEGPEIVLYCDDGAATIPIASQIATRDTWVRVGSTIYVPDGYSSYIIWFAPDIASAAGTEICYFDGIEILPGLAQSFNYNDQHGIVSDFRVGGTFYSRDIQASEDDTFYIGKNDDDSPRAFKGIILKDTTNGKYYRIDIINGVITATDLTD